MFLKLFGEKRLLKSVNLLPLNIKSIISLSLVSLINFLIFFGIYSIPKLSLFQSYSFGVYI